MISRTEAHKRLLIGYAVAIIGFVIGAKTSVAHPNPVMSSWLTAYILWSTYLGWHIVLSPVKEFFAGMIVFGNNFGSIFFHFILKKIIVFGIIIISALLVGFIGGAFLKQIYWSKIAYW